MHIAVIAANSRTGRAFVTRALAAGHTIRAGIYHTNTLTPHERLTIVHCNATNHDDLVNLLHNQDAVVSYIGHGKGSPTHVQSDAIRTLIPAMKACAVTRIVSLTGTGVRMPGDHIPLVDRIANATIRLVDPARVRDGIAHAKLLRTSTLEWTILRVLKLQNTRFRPYSLRAHGPTKWYVSRTEVADATLHVLEHHDFIARMPIVSTPFKTKE